MKLDLYYFDDHITNNIVILTEGIYNLSKEFEKIILLVSCILRPFEYSSVELRLFHLLEELFTG